MALVTDGAYNGRMFIAGVCHNAVITDVIYSAWLLQRMAFITDGGCNGWLL